MKSVAAPKRAQLALAAKPVTSLVDTGDPNRFVCPLFY